MIPFVVQTPPASQQAVQNPVYTYPNPVGAGNLLVIFFDWANTSGAVSLVNDPINGNWTQIDFQQPAGSVRTQYCFAVISKAGTITVTVSTDASRTYVLKPFEINGALITLDGAPVHNFSTTAVTTLGTGVLTTTHANSIILAAVKAGTISATPGSPWTSESSTNRSTAYQVGAAGSYSCSWTYTSSTVANTILAFQAAPGVDPGPMKAIEASSVGVATPGFSMGQLIAAESSSVFAGTPKILPGPSTPGPFPLIGCLLQQGALADPVAASNPRVWSIDYRTIWKNVQPRRPAGGVPTSNPNDPSYSWAYIDSCFADAESYGKNVWLRISCQEWQVPNWATAIIQQYTDCTGATRCLWYDPNYVPFLVAMAQAVSSRYASHASFKIYSSNMAASGAGDWQMPHVPASTVPTHAANWSLAQAWTCPPAGQNVTVYPAPGRPVYPGWVPWVPGFGWFLVVSVDNPKAPTVVVLQNLGYAGNATSGVVPQSTLMQVSDIQMLTSPMYNYTTAKVLSALNQMTDGVCAALPPGVVYSREVGRNNLLDPQPNNGITWSYNLSTGMAQHGYAAQSGKFCIAKNGFSSARSAPYTAIRNGDTDNFYLMAQPVFGSVNTSGTTGSIPQGAQTNGQCTWNIIDPSGQYLPSTTGGQSPYQANGGVPYGPDDCLRIFQQTLFVFRQYNTKVAELYEIDIKQMMPLLPPSTWVAHGGANSFTAPRQCRIYTMAGPDTACDERVLSDPIISPLVDGVIVETSWNSLAPSSGVFNFAFLDSEIARIGAVGKDIAFLFHIQGANAPPWIMSGLGVQTFTPATSGASPIWVPWDAIAQTNLWNLWQTIAARYVPPPPSDNADGSDDPTPAVGPNITVVAVQGEWAIPCTPADCTNWVQNYGYTSQQLINTILQNIGNLGNAFFNSAIYLPTGTNGGLDPTLASTLPAPGDEIPDYVCEQIIAAADAAYADGFRAGSNKLDALSPLPLNAWAVDFKIMYEAMAFADIGFEARGPCWNDAQFLNNGGVAPPNDGDVPWYVNPAPAGTITNASVFEKMCRTALVYPAMHFGVAEVDAINLWYVLAYVFKAPSLFTVPAAAQISDLSPSSTTKQIFS